MEKGLQVLYDWASQITDSDEEIEKERGIILEEMRGGRNANFRMQQEMAAGVSAWLKICQPASHW
jgi:zinc protease